MSTIKKTHDKSLNKLVFLMKRDTVVDRSLEIVTALSGTGDIQFDYKLVEYYDEINNQDLADALLQVIGGYSLSDIEQSFHTNYVNYRSLINQWKNDSVDFSNLDSLKLIQLNLYAELNNKISAKAISLQKLNGSSEYEEPTYFPAPSEKSFNPKEVEKITIKDNSLKIFPNPSVDYFTVDYVLVEPFEKGIMIVSDLKGNVIYSLEITNSQDQFIIPTTNLTSGTYTCSILIDGRFVSSKNVTIVN